MGLAFKGPLERHLTRFQGGGIMAAKATKWGGTRPGSGPKPKPPQERRRNRLVVNLTDAELEFLMAATEGKTLSDFVRGILLRSLRRRRS